MIYCKLIRFVIALHDSPSSDLPGWVQRHAAGCPCCSDVLKSSRQLEQALRTGAAGHFVEPPPFLRNRIIASLPKGQPSAESWLSRVLALRPATAFAVAAVAVSCVITVWYRHQQAAEMAAAAEAQAASHQVVAKTIAKTTSAINGENLLKLGTVFEQPLESEMQLILADARLAATSLARNFVPATYLASARP